MLDGYLAKMAERGIELHGHTPLFWSCGYAPGVTGGRPWPPRPYTKDRLCENFRRIRTLVFGAHDPRQLQDMRRSGAGEANLGDVNLSHLSAKMANTISESNRLQKAYLPKKLAVVRKVDEARLRGREKNKSTKK